MEGIGGMGGAGSGFCQAWSVADDDVMLIDLPFGSAPVWTGRYREGWPILLRSLGAIEGVYPAPGPVMFKPEGA